MKHQRTHGVDLSFDEFLNFVDEEHAQSEMFFKAMADKTGTGQAKTPVVGAKVAATSAATQVKTAAAPTSSTGCPACGANHLVAECAKFRDSSADDKRRICMSAGVCFRCIEMGHLARNCRSGVSCATCQQRHHTWAHVLQLQEGAAAATRAVAGATAGGAA